MVATTPYVSNNTTYEKNAVTRFIEKMSPATCIHLWGDINYEALNRSDIVMVPAEPVPEGHQGLVMSDVGPEPIIRLQTGGLKVGEVLAKKSTSRFDLDFCQFLEEE